MTLHDHSLFARWCAAPMLLVLALLLAGCARFPSTPIGGTTPARTLVSTMTVRGAINPVDYYFLAIGTDPTGASGPEPVVTGPEFGNGWGIIGPVLPNQTLPLQPPFYVEYGPDTAGGFQQFRLNATTNQYEPLGAPLHGDVISNGTGLRVEIDLSLLGTPTPSALQVNWLTMETRNPPIDVVAKQYDGFGPQGNDYFVISRTDIQQDWVSGQNGVPAELPYGMTYPNLQQELSTNNPDIDLIGWSIDIMVRSTALSR